MRHIILSLLVFVFSISLFSQAKGYWHGKERSLRYHPEGGDFVIVNGDRKFNRALYGTNTAFRVETGDVPEFGLFMPNMGGNMQLGLISGDKSLWLNDAEYIKSIYRPGARIYEIKDPFIGNGKLTISVLAMADAEGMVIKIESQNLPSGIQLLTLFGGASNKRFFRNGDLGVDDPNAFSLQPDACLDNEYQITSNQFVLNYAQSSKTGARHTIAIFPENSQLKLGSPYQVMTPLHLWKSIAEKNKPVVLSKTSLTTDIYIALKDQDNKPLSHAGLKKVLTMQKIKERK